MKKTKESIIAKWDKKLRDVELKEQIKLKNKKAELLQKCVSESKKLFEKCERKSKAYINKKSQEYDRKCKNEIRKLEWKEEKVYKKKEKKFNKLEFALSLVQENSKLRDSDENGVWICISCNRITNWSDFQGGHRYSRGVKWICLDFRNINGQCRSCNFATWPRGNPEVKDKTNAIYDVNLDKKYWEWTAEALHAAYVSYFHNVWGTNWDYWQHKDLDKFIEAEIEWNERLWEAKKFYKPWKKWRELREKRKE